MAIGAKNRLGGDLARAISIRRVERRVFAHRIEGRLSAIHASRRQRGEAFDANAQRRLGDVERRLR